MFLKKYLRLQGEKKEYRKKNIHESTQQEIEHVHSVWQKTLPLLKPRTVVNVIG